MVNVHLGALGAIPRRLCHCAKHQYSNYFAASTFWRAGSTVMDTSEPSLPRTWDLVDIALQCLYYGCGKSKTYCAVLYVLFMAAVGGFEAGLSLVVRRTDRAGDEWPTRRRRREAEVVAARSVSGDLEAGAPLHEGQIALAEAVAAVQSRQNSGRGSERSPTMPVMKEVDHDEP
ncbi:hypothetical protein FS749_011074 [Ceratobasidium sp. UAMH 11750]|nr:hypothetical protein FS749_011074 [Ceratobasidium sp. UAMH 11750]